MAMTDNVFNTPKRPFLSKEEKEKAENRLHFLQEICYGASTCLYIIDLIEEKIVYASDDFRILCGLQEGEIEEMGYEFYNKYIPISDIGKFEEIGIQTSKFLSNRSPSDGKHYSLRFNVHLHIGGQDRLCQHTSRPFMYASNGERWMLLCSLLPTSVKDTGEATLNFKGEKSYYQYDFKKHEWITRDIIELTEREKAILILSARGYTEEEIAAKLCKSHNSIKTSKRILFRKLGVSSIAEALMYSLNNHLL